MCILEAFDKSVKGPLDAGYSSKLEVAQRPEFNTLA